MRGFVIGCVVLMLVGCISRRTISESWVGTPTYEVKGVELVEQGEQAARLLAVIEVRNPNDVELPMRASSVSIEVEGVGNAAGQGVYAFEAMPAVSLPPGGSQVVTLPLAVTTRRGTSVAGSPYTLSASLSFEPPGEIRRILTDSGVPLPAVQVSHRGTVGATHSATGG